jgi:MFS transporter, DHA1 family, multidrug resistance protein
VGPFLGGMAADALGYRAVFPGASALMAIALAIVVFLVREDRSAMARPRVASARRGPRFSLGGLQAMAGANSLVLIGCLAGAAFAGSVVSPVLPLYLKALAPGTERIATLSGAMVSITAVTAAIASVGIGKLGDRYGQKLVLVSSTLGVAALAVPQAFVRSAAELLAWRGVHGTFVGGIMPTANALLARTTRPERRGAVFGLASGAQSGGMALGPALGAAVANQWGMGSAFLVTAGVFVLISLLVVGYVRTDSEMPEATPVEGVEVEYPAVVAEPATAPEAEA